MSAAPRVGDLVRYHPFGLVSFPARAVRVTAVHEDVKNGRPGFDGTVEGGPEEGAPVWGYTADIETVERHA